MALALTSHGHPISPMVDPISPVVEYGKENVGLPVPSVVSNDEYGVVVDSVDSNSNVIVSKKGVGKWNESIPVQNNDINKITKFISLAERAILG